MTGLSRIPPRTDTQTVNLLSIAAANGQTTTLDPSIAKLLGDIRTAAATTGGISKYDGNVDQYDYVRRPRRSGGSRRCGSTTT